MRFLLATLLTATFSFLAGLYTPWWSVAIVSFFVALLIKQRYGISFVSGLLGVFLCWAVLAWWIDSKNNSILSQKIAQLLPLGGSSFLLILVTGLVGGLAGGFGAMSGSSLRSAASGFAVK
jgi:hypothetical protein